MEGKLFWTEGPVVLVVSARLARLPRTAGALEFSKAAAGISMTVDADGLSRLGFGRLETRELLVFEEFPRARASSVS